MRPVEVALLVALATLVAILFWIVPLSSPKQVILPTPLPLSPQVAATLTIPKSPVLVRGISSAGEYYRGIYDVCIYFGAKEHPGQRVAVTRSCKELVRRLWLKRWHKEATQGWEWPLEEVGNGG